MKRLRRSASASVLESIKALIYLFFTFNCSIYMLFGHLRFAGSWKEQRWKIKAFPMEELWWFEWILLVLSSPFFFFFLHCVALFCFNFHIDSPAQNCRSMDCFRLGWPMRADADFFRLPPKQFNSSEDEVCINFGLHCLFDIFSVYFSHFNIWILIS